MKKKKIPLRKCIGCHEQFDKRELVRVVKPKDEPVTLDLTGRKNGRGAYLCNKRSCLEQAFKTKALERSLKCLIPEDLRQDLLEQIGAQDG